MQQRYLISEISHTIFNWDCPPKSIDELINWSCIRICTWRSGALRVYDKSAQGWWIMHSYAKASELFILESEPQIPRHARSGREYRLRPRPRRAGAHSGMVTTYEQEETINRERGRHARWNLAWVNGPVAWRAAEPSFMNGLLLSITPWDRHEKDNEWACLAHDEDFASLLGHLLGWLFDVWFWHQ